MDIPPFFDWRGPTISLILVATVGCGGDDVTAPSIPNVSGVYDFTQVSDAPNCEPAGAAEQLDPVMGHGTFHLVVQIEQQGAELTLTLLEANGHPPNGVNPRITTTLDHNGVIHVETHRTDQPSIFGVGTFTVELSSSSDGQFDTNAQPITFASVDEATFVFHVGTSPEVYAQCTQSGTETGTRRSG